MTLMDAPAPRALLHIGAPKCGSSAIQAAWTARGECRTQTGQRLRYIAWADSGGGRFFTPAQARAAGRASAYGYASCPDPQAMPDPEPFWSALPAMIAAETAAGRVPVLSNESWIHQARSFDWRFAHGGVPRSVAVLAFVRPPVDWLNAAYWQWAVWSGTDFATWSRHPLRRYTLLDGLADWAALPWARLAVRSARPDVLTGFAAATGVTLTDINPGETETNASTPPALVRFLLRNRRFRPTAHAAAVEFILGRWCQFDAAAHPALGRPWAISPRDLDRIASQTRGLADRLRQIVPEAEADAILADPGWTDPIATYGHRTETRAAAQTETEALLAALDAGLARAAAAAHSRLPALPDRPSRSATGFGGEDPAIWDRAIAARLDALIACDGQIRARHGGPARRLWQMIAERRAAFAALPAAAPPPPPAPPPTLRDRLQGPLPGEDSLTQALTARSGAALSGPDGGMAYTRALLVIVAQTGPARALADALIAALPGIAPLGDPFAPYAAAASSPEMDAETLPAALTQRIGALPAGALAAITVNWPQLALLIRWRLLPAPGAGSQSAGPLRILRLFHAAPDAAAVALLRTSLPPDATPDQRCRRIDARAHSLRDAAEMDRALAALIGARQAAAELALSVEAIRHDPAAALAALAAFAAQPPAAAVALPPPDPKVARAEMRLLALYRHWIAAGLE